MSKANKDENYTGKISNLIIGSKYGATLLENQIMLLGFFSIQQGKCIETNDGIIVEFSASEIKKLTNSNSGTIYAQLNNLAKVVTTRVIGYSDPISKKFDYINVINRITYENNKLTMKFNNDLKELIKDVPINYTLLERKIMMSFKSVYSFRLYELLKSRCYSRDKNKQISTFNINYNLAELKFELGVADANANDAVRILLKGSENPDYDLALEKVPAPLKKYDRWSNFEKRILCTAEDEINNKDIGMRISHTPIKGNLGGKVVGISFHVEIISIKLVEPINISDNNEVSLSSDDLFALKAEIYVALKDFGVTLNDIDSICKEADFNRDKIFKAIDVFKNSSNVENVVGFLIQACRDDYSVIKSSANKNKLNKFDQRNYSHDFFEKLENAMSNK